MAFQLTWTIEGEKQLSRRLQGIKEGFGDWRPAFEKTAKYLVDVFANDVFSSNGGAIGESWKPLSPTYLAAKRKAGYPADILVRTGTMKNSFKSLFDPTSAEVWNAMQYFAYHQSNKSRQKIPRRVMMKFGEKQKQMVTKIFHEHFVKVIKTA